jgi:hypothetical protein
MLAPPEPGPVDVAAPVPVRIGSVEAHAAATVTRTTTSESERTRGSIVDVDRARRLLQGRRNREHRSEGLQVGRQAVGWRCGCVEVERDRKPW